MSIPTQTLDARGLQCPMPILRARRALNGLASGDTLKVLASDPGSIRDIASFCDQTGNRLVATVDHRGEISFLIRKL